jgi:hypothetical protein
LNDNGSKITAIKERWTFSAAEAAAAFAVSAGEVSSSRLPVLSLFRQPESAHACLFHDSKKRREREIERERSFY